MVDGASFGQLVHEVLLAVLPALYLALAGRESAFERRVLGAELNVVLLEREMTLRKIIAIALLTLQPLCDALVVDDVPLKSACVCLFDFLERFTHRGDVCSFGGLFLRVLQY